MIPQAILDEIASLLEFQKNKLLSIGSLKVNPFTEEDLLQPFDFKELATDKDFLYEEGVYHGQLEVYTLLKRMLVDLAPGFKVDNHTFLPYSEHT